MIDRTVLSLGGGQISVGNQNYGSGGMGVSFASRLQNDFYLGAEIDGAAFNASDKSVDMNSGLDVLMNLSPLIGYRIGESLYLYAKAGYTFGTISGGEQPISGMRWGGMAQYDLTDTLTLGASIMSGQVSVDYVGGSTHEALTQTMINLGKKF
jgi:hypothetical protein